MLPGWQQIFWRTREAPRSPALGQPQWTSRADMDYRLFFEPCTSRGRGKTPSRGQGKSVLRSSSSSGMDRLLPLIHVHRNQGTVVLVSEHRDGDYLARLLHHFGFGTVRGSSTRGGVRGLKGLIRAARRGEDLAITPDGPRGPNRELKLGALTVARMTGLPLVPVGVGVTSSWRILSWDGLLVPKPFSTVRVAYGPPTLLPRNADQAEIDDAAASLQHRLGDLSDQVGDTEPLSEVEDPAPLTEAADAERSGPFGDIGPS